MEEWRSIDGYPNYTVSNFGNVFSKNTGKIMNPSCINGYAQLSLCDNGSKKNFRVHKLVANAFLGLSELDVDHIDGNKENNAVSNLQYVSKEHNTRLRNIRKNRKNLIGAYKDKRRGFEQWYSLITIGNKRKMLGVFPTEKEAHEAYMKELKVIDIVSYNHINDQALKELGE